MATKTHNYNHAFSYSTNGSTYTELTDVKDITPPTEERGRTEVTHLKSSNFTKEYINSWKDAGEARALLYWHKTLYATLQGFLDDGVNYYWKITSPLIDSESTASTLVFRGSLKQCTIQPIQTGDDAVMVELIINTTGETTFTAGS